MSTEGHFVPGIFSQAGRETAFEIENLQNHLKLEGDSGHDEDQAKAAAKSSKAKKTSGAAKSQDDVKPQTPAGELAKAIQEKLRTSTNKAEDKGQKQDPHSSKGQSKDKDGRLTTPFHFEGKEGNWASKFTATYDIGSINHRNEQCPHVAWYKIKHDSVLDRPPHWDINARPKHQPRKKPEPDPSESPMAFMTSVDINDQEAMQALTARQRTMLKDAMGLGPEKPKQNGTAMGLNSERGPLGKIGRVHVLANEVRCAEDSDLLDQDIKGYHKLRYPRWDMDAYSARSPLLKGDDIGEPGKYDYSLDCVKAVPKNGVGFGKALPRSVCVSTMGYSAPQAVLHPEEKRTRGMLPDRSKSKDAVRHRFINVNDFDKEMARPPLPVLAGQNFHDTNDPSACEAVYQREMSYDADSADVYVTHRRDIAPKYARMLPRGKHSVQGLRALSSDLAVRGSVGLGFVETLSQVHHSVDRREARASDGRKENPNIGVNLDHTTYNVHTPATEKMLRGRALVRGSGLDAKPSALGRKEHPILINAFKRSPSLPGFDARSKFGGTRVLAGTRSSSAIAGWAPEELERVGF